MCSAPAARSRSDDDTTTEMRIVDVEIITMLTPSSARIRNILAAIPGLDFMPAPTREILAIASSWEIPVAPICFATSATIDSATFMSALGTVKLMSVVPSDDVF